MKPRLTLVAFALASTLLTTGCGEGAVDGAGQSTGRADATPSANTSPARQKAPQDASPRTVEGRSASGDAAGGGAPRLEDVRVTEHGTFDRVRFDFSGDISKVFAEYMDALREPGRGRQVPLAGEHQLVLVLVGVARQNPSIDAEPTAAVREVRTSGVFEGEMIVGIGTDTEGAGPAGYRVRLGDDTVTVDVAHRASASASPSVSASPSSN